MGGTRSRIEKRHYQHQPLEAKEFRILELLPGSLSEVVRCRLRHYTFDNTPEFYAVSYAWGTEKHDQGIKIEGQDFCVTPNVNAALKVFRNRGIRDIWIDTICINQKDLEERSRQVKLMSQLYGGERCKHLLVWLGVETEDSAAAIDFIRQLTVKLATTEEQFQEWIKSLVASNKSQEILDSITALMARSWFPRAWVLQEFALSLKTKTFFFCGDKVIDQDAMSEFSIGINALWNAARLDSVAFDQMRVTFYTGMNRFLRLIQGRQILDAPTADSIEEYIYVRLDADTRDMMEYRKQNTNLGYWLELNRDALATDPRDKVFSVLGIVDTLVAQGYNSGYDPGLLRVDYSDTIENIFSSVVRSIVATTGTLNILGSCSQPAQLVQRSWTPDWTVPRRRGSFFGEGRSDRPFTAASGDRQCQVTFAEELSTLTVRGLVWDVVTFSSAAPMDVCKQLLANIVEGGLYDSSVSAVEQMLSVLNNELCYSIRPSSKDTQDFEKGGSDGRPSTKSAEDEIRVLQYTAEIKDGVEAFQVWDRSLLITGKGCIGQTASYDYGAREGDVVCILLGCRVPMILRPVRNYYKLVSDVYIKGIMDGEAIEALEKGEYKLQDFELR